MGGQDRRDAQPGEDRLQLGVTAPAVVAEPRDRLRDGIVEVPVARRPLAAPECPDPPARLGQVDQLEVQGEGLDDRFGLAQIEPVEHALEPFALRRVVAAAQGDGRSAQPLDELEQRRAGLLDDDLAKESAEQTDLDR
jgi:hypothetical protein